MAPIGCGSSVNLDETGGGTEPGGAGDGSEGNGTSGSALDSDSSGSAPSTEDVPARGVTIRRVEANPGVAVKIAENGQWVDGSQRVAPLPRLRNTAFRIYVDVDEDVWVTRDIEARVIMTLPDGTEETYSTTAEIAQDSSESSLQSNILVGVLAEAMQPGAEFQVELWEGGGDYSSLPEATSPPLAMPEPAQVGIQSDYLNMRIVLVPVEYSFGSCTTSIDVSDESIAKYEDAIFQQNPLESLELTVHEPLSVTDLDLASSSGFFALLPRISQLRAAEAPGPEVYYYGLFDNCGTCISQSGGGCVLGVASGLAGASQGDAGSRVAIGTQFLGNEEVGIETFVHEVGHNQGRAHIECPGADAAGPDFTFPHEGGRIGTWGFGVRDFQVRGATSHTDYMSYCSPTWVSDWQWRATFERIRTLSAWETSDASASQLAGKNVLVGAYNPQTGESTWWTDRGYISADQARSPQFSVEFLDRGAVVRSESAQIQPWSEGSWVTVRVPLVEGFEQTVTGIALHGPKGTQRVSRAAINVLHASDRLLAPQ